jgi:hypothetical protein
MQAEVREWMFFALPLRDWSQLLALQMGKWILEIDME